MTGILHETISKNITKEEGKFIESFKEIRIRVSLLQEKLQELGNIEPEFKKETDILIEKLTEMFKDTIFKKK